MLPTADRRLNKITKKVIAMEIESTNHQDVAEPDQMASGVAGTGQENEELEWAKRHTRLAEYRDAVPKTENDELEWAKRHDKISAMPAGKKTRLREQSTDPVGKPDPRPFPEGEQATGLIATIPAGTNKDEGNAQDSGQNTTSQNIVERKTGLRGQSIDPVRRPERLIRRRTERDLLAYDSDVPYAAVERANRDLVCSLIERQDLVTEKLLLMINDLQYRVDDLELTLEALVQKKDETPESGPAGSRKERDRP
jgi:hypothetical protein